MRFITFFMSPPFSATPSNHFLTYGLDCWSSEYDTQLNMDARKRLDSGSPNARKREWDYGSPNAAGSGNAIHHILHVTAVFSNAV